MINQQTIKLKVFDNILINNKGLLRINILYLIILIEIIRRCFVIFIINKLIIELFELYR
jgi:hypothetical protein